jgi:CubicO group peptidase (beta-lactamase class C family)
LLLGVSVYAPAQDRASKAKSVVSVLQPFVDRQALAGAVVLVADRDKILCLECVGYSDVAEKKPMRPDALFWIASQTKPMTAAALMMLVDEGKVHLDDPITKYLPEFANQWLAAEQDKNHMLLVKPTHLITVRQLLCHTSGMGGTSFVEEPTLDLLPLRTGVRSYAMTPLHSEPGSKYQYSNAGINTAGRIIEVVSDMPYAQFMHKRLFEPLGMKDTTFWPNVEQVTCLAKSYRPNKAKTGLDETTISQLKYPLTDRTRQPMPAGGLFSTASDIGKFCQLLLNSGAFQGKRYLTEAAVSEMRTKQTGPDIRESYGLGLSTSGTSFGHGGAYATQMNIDLKHGLVTVFLVQHAGFPLDGGRSWPAFSKAAADLFSNPATENR